MCIKGAVKIRPYAYVKKILDLLFAIILLILLSPIMIVSAIAIKIETPGPILFRQKRPGKKGKIFTIYKFRTMRVETEKNGRKLSDMERMTKIGKIFRTTSIDELPQLFNILKGDMSFIGPRPLLVEYLDRYTPEQMRRHDVTPGISGWAQINGRNALDWEEKFKLDVWYVDHISFKLDFKIFVMTIKNIWSRVGINCSDDNTMTIFKGSPQNTAQTRNI